MKAVSSAVKTYNEAASRLGQPTLVLDDVLKYVFIGEFDMIRMSRFGLSHQPWARKAEREAAVDFFKLQRSHEEIQRLNIEIRRLYVHIFHSETKLQLALNDLETKGSPLAFQMKKRRDALRSLNVVHLRRLQDVQSWPSYSGPKVCISQFFHRKNRLTITACFSIFEHYRPRSPVL